MIAFQIAMKKHFESVISLFINWLGCLKSALSLLRARFLYIGFTEFLTRKTFNSKYI